MNENENKNAQTVEEESQSDKKGASGFWSKASSMGKKVADNVQKNAAAMAEKAKAENHQRKLDKYNPLFLEEYKSENFLLPTMIRIVDTASIQSIDVCEGAIGWRDRSTEIEVLSLSADFAASSSISFFPGLALGAMYYRDTHDDGQYINIERIFGKAHEEKLAELENIAYLLGAKRCSVELVEADGMDNHLKNHAEIKSKFGASKSEEKSQSFSHSMSGKTVSTFNGNSTPRRPDLKWFKNDRNILSLIEMRCSDSNSIQTRTLVLEGSSSVAMEHSQAKAIDMTIQKIGCKIKSSLERQYTKEYSSKLVFEVEF